MAINIGRHRYYPAASAGPRFSGPSPSAAVGRPFLEFQPRRSVVLLPIPDQYNHPSRFTAATALMTRFSHLSVLPWQGRWNFVFTDCDRAAPNFLAQHRHALDQRCLSSAFGNPPG